MDKEDKSDAIHTGFYYETHKRRLFEVLFIIPTQKVCFQLPPKKPFDFRRALGTPMFFYNSCFEIEDDYKSKWYVSYDVSTGAFHSRPIKKIQRPSKNVIDCVILDDDTKISAFTMMNYDWKEDDEYPLQSTYVPMLFRGGDGFEPINDDIERDELPPRSYGKYRGYYVQDVEGYDDDFIDDVLDGHPDAYWNID